jgi:hypothetical protein
MPVQVFAKLVHIPEEGAVAHLFEEACNGVVGSMDSAMHYDQQGLHAKDSIRTSDTVFLVVRNECRTSVRIIVEHDLALMFTMPLTSANRLLQVRDHAP